MAILKTTQRNCVITSIMVAAGGAIGNGACQQTHTTTAQVQTSPSPTPSESGNLSSITPNSVEIPQTTLGSTNISVPILGLGGAGRTSFSRSREEQEAIAIIERALDLGIRYFDTASSYAPAKKG